MSIIARLFNKFLNSFLSWSKKQNEFEDDGVIGYYDTRTPSWLKHGLYGSTPVPPAPTARYDMTSLI